MDDAAPTPEEPVLRIVTADATPEELAAIVAVFAALVESASDGPPPPARRPVWNAPHRMVRTAQRHGPDGWRTSGLPR
jgi:hypothetical protein